ncbi:MAG: prepilin peptidase [Chloroflexi bacterium]|nr:prepilin peptidase [Chloroflexota bacterium]
MSLWLFLLLAAWLVAMSAYDLNTRQVPNWLTLPPLLIILAWQLVHRQWWALLALPLIYSLWHLYILGGADAKVLATLFALWPGSDFLIFFCVGYVIVALPVLLLRWRRGAGALLHLPSEAYLEEHGTPAIPMYSLVALAYALLLLVRFPA